MGVRGLAGRLAGCAHVTRPRAAHPLRCAAAAAAVLACAAVSRAALVAAPLPPTFAQYLQAEGFSSGDLASITAGRAIARGLPRPERDEAGAIGVVRIELAADAFAARVRDIVRFERGPGVAAVGRFSVPARSADLQGFTVPDADADDLAGCKLDDCDVNLSAADIERLARVDQRGPGGRARLTYVAREGLAAYVADYQRRGVEALLVYRDRTPPFSVREASGRLLRQAEELRAMAPEVAAFLERYPERPLPPGGEHFFYWSVMSFGMKPVTRASHLVLAPFTIDGLAGYVIASRTLYASHYFRDGLEVKFVVPVPGEAAACYLVSVNRSHSESLTGVKGLLLGAKIRSSARSGVERHVLHVKREVERGTP